MNKDKYIKEILLKDISISEKADKIFNTYEEEIRTKDFSYQITPKKNRRLFQAVSVAVVLLLILGGFALGNLYNQRLQSTETELIAKKEEMQGIINVSEYAFVKATLKVDNKVTVKINESIKDIYTEFRDKEIDYQKEYIVEDINHKIKEVYTTSINNDDVIHVLLLREDTKVDYIEIQNGIEKDFKFKDNGEIKDLSNIVSFEKENNKIYAIKQDGTKLEICLEKNKLSAKEIKVETETNLEEQTKEESNELSKEEIAIKVFSEYLDGYKKGGKEQVDEEARIKNYTFKKVEAVDEDTLKELDYPENMIVVSFTYDIELYQDIEDPDMCLWIAGNGFVEGNWVRSKSNFVLVKVEGSNYKFVATATGL